ncbi:hypothetical protein F4861DRAFT_513886 [Xylaria intraflava]|nr:hypothetical protein F4861DRAFT_513886 [Xylaria intraflava]
MAEPKQLLKIEAFHYKLPSVSDDDFKKYVDEELTPKWLAVVKRHGVVRYTSTFTPSTFAKQFGPTLEKVRPGWTMKEAHMTLTYYVEKFEDMLELVGDPEYQSRGRDIEIGWIDASQGQLKLGWETTYIENGQVVNTTVLE